VRALALAERAIHIMQAPHIWDTLAQCLFVNGYLEEAIAAEQRAIEMDPEDYQLYEDQLIKFKNARN
jgi:tetratricopeptide (TPR) repeat protein